MSCNTPGCQNEALQDKPHCIECFDLLTLPMPFIVDADGGVTEDPDPPPCHGCAEKSCACRCPNCAELWERCACVSDEAVSINVESVRP